MGLRKITKYNMVSVLWFQRWLSLILMFTLNLYENWGHLWREGVENWNVCSITQIRMIHILEKPKFFRGAQNCFPARKKYKSNISHRTILTRPLSKWNSKCNYISVLDHTSKNWIMEDKNRKKHQFCLKLFRMVPLTTQCMKHLPGPLSPLAETLQMEARGWKNEMQAGSPFIGFHNRRFQFWM